MSGHYVHDMIVAPTHDEAARRRPEELG